MFSLENPYQRVYEQLNIQLHEEMNKEEAEIMITHLGLLYNTFGQALKDVIKMVSFRYSTRTNKSSSPPPEQENHQNRVISKNDSKQSHQTNTVLNGQKRESQQFISVDSIVEEPMAELEENQFEGRTNSDKRQLGSIVAQQMDVEDKPSFKNDKSEFNGSNSAISFENFSFNQHAKEAVEKEKKLQSDPIQKSTSIRMKKISIPKIKCHQILQIQDQGSPVIRQQYETLKEKQ